MKCEVHATAAEATAAAGGCLARWLGDPAVRSLMVAAGNSPLDLYADIAQRAVPLAHLEVFALDEYVGVPADEPRNCANLLRRTVAEAWGIPPQQYHTVSSEMTTALTSVLAHEQKIESAGGLDVIVLGLGQNGHLGFNEPGSADDSTARVLPLEAISIEANRVWFRGDYAPNHGVTIGMKTILAARRILVLAFGAHKRSAVQAMLHGPRSPQCPASLLQGHAGVEVFLDAEAAKFQPLRRMETRTTILGIDVGGTKIAAGLLAWPSGEVLRRLERPTRPERGGRAVLDEVVEMCRDLAVTSPPAAIGLGVCELVNRAGRLASEHTIKWLDLPVCEELSAVAPTCLEADVRAAARAEAAFGAGRDFRQFLYVTIGTGISCCLMLDGQPHLGAHGATGTMASSPLAQTCESCRHTTPLTLEQLAAGPGLVARFNAAHGHATSGPEVLAAAENGHSVARHIVDTATSALGSHLGLLVNVLDPEAIIFGGGLGLSEGLYRRGLVAAIRQQIWSPANRDLPILSAATGAEAGWIGAAVRAANFDFTASEPINTQPLPKP